MDELIPSISQLHLKDSKQFVERVWNRSKELGPIRLDTIGRKLVTCGTFYFLFCILKTIFRVHNIFVVVKIWNSSIEIAYENDNDLKFIVTICKNIYLARIIWFNQLIIFLPQNSKRYML